MSDYSNGRMSSDVIADAQAAIIADLEATGKMFLCVQGSGHPAVWLDVNGEPEVNHD